MATTTTAKLATKTINHVQLQKELKQFDQFALEWDSLENLPLGRHSVFTKADISASGLLLRSSNDLLSIGIRHLNKIIKLGFGKYVVWSESPSGAENAVLLLCNSQTVPITKTLPNITKN